MNNLTKGQKSALIVFTIAIILFIINEPEFGFLGLCVGGLCLLPKI
jgi:hypothetical protein